MYPFISEQLVADHRALLLADAHHSRPVRDAVNGRHAAPPRSRTRWRRRLALCSLGLAAAIVTSASGPTGSGPEPSTSRRRADPVTPVGLGTVASEHLSYEPGASRTWSPDPAIVGVKVLSGRLTVYGADWDRRVYAAGDAYVAGWAAHRTANETREPVETLVTSYARP